MKNTGLVGCKIEEESNVGTCVDLLIKHSSTEEKGLRTRQTEPSLLRFFPTGAVIPSQMNM